MKNTGTGLCGADASEFDSASATGISVSSGHPAEGGVFGEYVEHDSTTPVNITVTTSGATSTTRTADHFTNLPAVTAISPAVGLTAAGTTVTISGIGLAGATAVQFGTVAAPSLPSPARALLNRSRYD